MSGKNRVKITVDGKTFTLMGYETEEHIKNVAEYIDNKLHEIRKNASSVPLDASLIYILTSINVADDFFKELEKTRTIDTRLQVLQKETDAIIEEKQKEINAIIEEKQKEINAIIQEKQKETDAIIEEKEELLEKVQFLEGARIALLKRVHDLEKELKDDNGRDGKRLRYDRK